MPRKHINVRGRLQQTNRSRLEQTNSLCHTDAMRGIALKLQETLASPGPVDATLLERLVNDSLALAKRRPGKQESVAVDG